MSKGGLEGQSRTEGHYLEGADPSDTHQEKGEKRVCQAQPLLVSARLFPGPAGVLKEIQSTLEGDRG